MSTEHEQPYHMFHGVRCRPRPLSHPLSSLYIPISLPAATSQAIILHSTIIIRENGSFIHHHRRFPGFFLSLLQNMNWYSVQISFGNILSWAHSVTHTQTHVQEIVGELFLAQLPVSRIVYFDIFFLSVILQKARFAIISITHMPYRSTPMLNSTTRCCTYHAHVEHMPANVDEDISGIRRNQQKNEMFWFWRKRI